MKKQHNESGSVKRFLFVCYGAVMLYLLFAGGRNAQSDLPYWQRVADNYNLIPFYTVRNYWDILARPEHYLQKWEAAIYREQAKAAMINLAGNVVMFIPLGVFLPMVWKGLQRFWKTLLTATGVIILVELVQLVSLRGSCDVDDLILNLFGVAVGYVSWRAVHFLRCKRK